MTEAVDTARAEDIAQAQYFQKLLREIGEG